MDLKLEKIYDRLDRSDKRLDLLASDVTNLRAAFGNFRVFVVQPISTSSAYASPAHTPPVSMMATSPTPRMDQPSSSIERPSISQRDPSLREDF